MNKNIKSELAIGIILLVVIIVGGVVWLGGNQQLQNKDNLVMLPVANQAKEPIVENGNDLVIDNKTEPKTNVFFATASTGKININIFDSKNKFIVASRKIELDDTLGSSTNNGVGLNDAVQYNPITKNIFIFTDGDSRYDGSCRNKDKTCFYRIYRINLDNVQQKPEILFQTKDAIVNWQVGVKSNSVFVGISAQIDNGHSSRLVLKSINPSDKTVKTISENASVGGRLILSADEKSIFQIISGDNIVLSKIDILTGTIEKTDVFQGNIGFPSAAISPDGNFIAFHQSGLKIYDVLNKKIINYFYGGEIGNYGLSWSGDSEKIVYILKNKLAYYDIKTGKETIIEQGENLNAYVYGWAPSKQYVMYKSGGDMDTVKFYDIFQDKKVEFNQDIFSKTNTFSIYGIDWF
ncbi:MAG: hypothetical protein WCK16_03560 [Candidatus Moraniibacteriota bacterium]